MARATEEPSPWILLNVRNPEVSSIVLLLEKNQFYRKGFSKQPNNLTLLLAKKTDKTHKTLSISNEQLKKIH